MIGIKSNFQYAFVSVGYISKAKSKILNTIVGSFLVSSYYVSSDHHPLVLKMVLLALIYPKLNQQLKKTFTIIKLPKDYYK